MATLTGGSSVTIGMDAWATLSLVVTGSATLAFTSGAENVHPSFEVTKATSRNFGPFGCPMSVVITAADRDLTYTITGGVGGFTYGDYGNVTGLVGPDGRTIIRSQRDRVGALTPYRLAVYGDSRANVATTHTATATSATTMSGEKVATHLCMLRGDMQICFNGGISGDTAANWNSASRISSSQDVAALVAANPDLVLVQYGINDLIAGTSASTILTNLQAFAAKVIGAGIPFVFESTNTAAAASATYINGYSSAGGFGSSASTKLAALASVRSGMQSFLAQFPGHLAIYVDTSSVSDATDGYAKTDKTYYDGTHFSRRGAREAAALIDAALAPYFPRRVGTALKLAYPNGMNFAMLSPSSGRASNFSAIIQDNGSSTATYQVGQDADGNYYQQYNITVSALASGYFAVRCEALPDWVGGSPFFTLAAADVMQGSIDYMVDDGSGGAPIVSHFQARPRIYYDDASNEYTAMATVAQLASTDYPAIAAAESGRCVSPRLAVKAAMASSNMTASTALQFIVYGVTTGSFRLRLWSPQWAKVA